MLRLGMRPNATQANKRGNMHHIGPHVTTIWPSTQQIIAFRSADAEFYALFKCACQTLGKLNFASDVELTLKATVHIDASAVLAITR